MKKFVVSVFDVQAQTFSNPVFVPSIGVGVRMVADEVNRADPQNVLYAHSEDFRVFDLGTWEDQTGIFTAHPLPQLLCDCVSLRK